MRISDWSSDVCSSDLPIATPATAQQSNVRPETFYGLAQETLPAVVSILATRNADDGAGPGGVPGARQLPPGLEEFFERFFGQEVPEGFGAPGPQQGPMPAQAIGSGFIIDPEG